MKLEMTNVSKQYPKTLALDGFSAELTSGLYGLLGPNGAGKNHAHQHHHHAPFSHRWNGSL